MINDAQQSTYLVCPHCGGDTLGMVSDYEARKGYDAHCFDCERAINKKEVPFVCGDDAADGV